MGECVLTKAEAAEHLRKSEAEAAAHRQKLEGADKERLEAVLRDPSQPATARMIAFEQLLHAYRPSAEFPSRPAYVAHYLGALIEDPDQAVAEMAVRHCPLTDEGLRNKIRHLLDSPHDRLRANAAVALAQAKDETVLPRLHEWFAGADETSRRIAVEGLVRLNTPEARSTLENAYHQGGRSDEDRILLAIALLRLGDAQALPFLEAIAQRAQSPWSVTAAAWIYSLDNRRGLELMLHLLDNGDAETKLSATTQVWNWARTANPYTDEGAQQARAWIEKRLASNGAAP